MSILTSIINFLKKIGILKTWNTKGAYKNASDRSDKFVEKDLYDGAESNSFSSIDKD